MTYAAKWTVERPDGSPDTSISGVRFATKEEAEEYGREAFGEHFSGTEWFLDETESVF